MEIFDNEAQFYDDWYKTPLGKFVDEVETNAIMDLLKPRKDELILDVGCGTGNYSLKLSRLGVKVVGVDVSHHMLKIAKEKFVNESLDGEFYIADAMSLPFEDNRFDACLAVASVEFIPNPIKAIEEMFRVVKFNGRIVVGFLNRESLWGRLYSSEEFRRNTVFRFAQLLSVDEIRSIKGSNLVEIRESLFIPPNAEVDQLDWKIENLLSKTNKGGFISALWKKR